MPAPDLPRWLELDRPDDLARVSEVLAGLRAPRPWVSPKFFYDRLGSRLFEAITELDEYYPTRTEAAILRAHADRIGEAVLEHTGAAPVMVDLGAGNCEKALGLFPVLGPRRYVALDISVAFLGDALQRVQREYPALETIGVGIDFATRLALPERIVEGRAVVFYPGSSIGNFAPKQALRLLGEAQALAAGGALLIGVDLVKPAAQLEAAYDDPLGVTAAFNLNLLRHLNRLVGADFDVSDWRHVAFFDPVASRVEMHLEARRALRVRWPGGGRDLAAGERIHTENAYKWTPEGFEALLRQAGCERIRWWTDPQDRFAVFVSG